MTVEEARTQYEACKELHEAVRNGASITACISLENSQTHVSMPEDIEDMIKTQILRNYQDACKEYRDAISELKEELWEEYMSTYSS